MNNLFDAQMRHIAAALLLTASLAGLAGCHSHSHETPQTATAETHAHEEAEPTIAALTEAQIQTVGIELGQVAQKELTATIKANGQLSVPNNSKANATSLYGGVVKRLLVQMGDHVRKGQPVAEISNPQFLQLQEEYLTLDSRIALAQQETNRQQELNQGNAGALKNLQSATAELASLRTRRASLQQQISLMGIDPSSLRAGSLHASLWVNSPIRGVISNVFAKIGSYVDVSAPVAEIVDNSALHLDLQVFEKDLPQLRVGQIIHFTLTNNPVREYDAEVFSIGAAFENESKTIPVHARVKGDKTGLIDGMNITGIVSLSKAVTPAVPNEAIVEADGKFYVFIRTDKAPPEPAHEEAGHDHDHDEAPRAGNSGKPTLNFEKIEVVKGVSEMGYTAVTFVQDLPPNAQLVTKGAFFINAKLSNTGGHEH